MQVLTSYDYKQLEQSLEKDKEDLVNDFNMKNQERE